jgi:hypothetical protein
MFVFVKLCMLTIKTIDNETINLIKLHYLLFELHSVITTNTRWRYIICIKFLSQLIFTIYSTGNPNIYHYTSFLSLIKLKY